MKTYRRKNAIGEQFAPRTIRMLESPAYRALSLSARRVLDRVEIELAHHGGFENGKLPITFAQFEEYGIGNRRSIAAAIRECCALGFLEITLAGRAGNREFRRANLFRLTYRHLDRAQPTHEWTRIPTIEFAQEIARAARADKKQLPDKHFSSGSSSTFSVAESATENPDPLVAESATTTLVPFLPLPLESRARSASQRTCAAASTAPPQAEQEKRRPPKAARENHKIFSAAEAAAILRECPYLRRPKRWLWMAQRKMFRDRSTEERRTAIRKWLQEQNDARRPR
jgi:hypothetical protein